MPELTDTALRVLKSRYFLKDEKGEPKENWEQLCWRVADAVAAADAQYLPDSVDKDDAVKRLAHQFFGVIHELDFLPNSPTLMNAGTPMGQLSACFLIDVLDDMESIFDAVKDMAIIFKSGGGVGIPLSALREKGALVKTTGGKSSGPVSFMRVYNTVAEVVSQGGKRRGALMGTLRIDHPDIIDFIQCKQDTSEFTCFNTSVLVTKSFISALEKHWETGDDVRYPIICPQTGDNIGDRSARDVYELIVQCAHRTGEPGLVFIDEINDYHIKEVCGQPVIGTNPCGELPLRAYESCNLGSINLSRIVENGEIDWDFLEETVMCAVHFLDNVIDINTFPLEKIKERTLEVRKIGLGVMGLADMLAKLGLEYGTEDALSVITKLFANIRRYAEAASVRLAEDRGSYNLAPKGTLRRNGTLLSIAPTGSISLIAGVTGGIEPFFSVATYRQGLLDNEEFIDVNETFKYLLEKELGEDDAMLVYFKLAEGVSMEEAGVPEHLQDLFVCAHQIPAHKHIATQSVVQRNVDNAVSKTVNLPNEATLQDVDMIFRKAWRNGCKGVTVYRDGCRDNQPMTVAGKKEKKDTEGPFHITLGGDGFIKPDARPDSLPGVTKKVKTGCGTLFVTISVKDGRPVEIFAHHGKAGVCSQAQCESIGRLTSLALRSHLNPEEIAMQLRGITCHQPWGMGTSKVHSCGDGIAQVLLDVLNKKEDQTSSGPRFSGSCPECGGPLKDEGCIVCTICGYEKCQ